jgi:CRISP-associated protein Cas1
MKNIEKPYVVPLKDREPYIFLEYGSLSADSHAFIFTNKNGCFDIPAAMFSVIFIQPGVSVTHEAIKLAAQHKSLIMWVGEESVRLYAVGFCDSSKSASRITKQVLITTNPDLRLKSARTLYSLMFDESAINTFNLDQLRGREGAKVRQIYNSIANSHNIIWESRDKAPKILQQCLGMATSCLYALCESVIWMSGYHPSIGIVHSGNAHSLAYDLADTLKFKTVIPLAFRLYSAGQLSDPFVQIRHACRDFFKSEKTMEKLFHNLETIFDVGHYPNS